MEKMKKLVKTLNNASKAYYQEDEEIISNLEYDALYDELIELEEETGIVLEGSPTKNVGFKILSSLIKVRHESKMLSLDKTKEIDKLISFLEDYEGVLSWKLDGLTIVLKYENGNLVRAVTRGNGEIGEDVTHNAKHFKNVPLEIDYKKDITLRGEAVISYKEFEKINEKLPEEDKYKNPRNLCSGTVRQLDSKISASRNVEYYVFTVQTEDEGLNELKSDALDFIEGLGFKHVGYEKVRAEDLEENVLKFKENILKFSLPSDGLVLTINDIKLSRQLGETSKFPKDSLAFKWEDEIKETKLLEIIWNTSRTGLINPIAVFESVELEGTTVERASLHNLSIVENLELGIGDKITVYKANMIIPQISENLTRSNNFKIPEKCSVCSGNTEIDEKNGIKFLYCINPNCSAQKVKSLTHYTSRDAMNIEGLSEATIERFISEKFLNNYMDIYSLKDHEEDLKQMKGFGERSIIKLIDAIEKSKACNIANFIYALGINHIGLANAKLLAKDFNGDIIEITKASVEEIASIDGFGEIMAKSVVDYFSTEENLLLLEKALEILKIEKPQAITDNKMGDMTFVVTGEVNIFKNRKEVQSYIESKGGKVSSAVTSKTDYLINNDTLSASSKNKKAKELEIPILSEDDFIKMFEIDV